MGDSDEFIAFDDGFPTLSRAAFQLHFHGMMNSLKYGQPGVITDEYLNAISAETTVTAAELCTAGLWRRFDEGYVIVDRKSIEMALDAQEQVLGQESPDNDD